MMAFAFSSLSIQYRRRRAYPWHLHSHLTIQYKRRTAYEERSIPKTDQASTQQEMLKMADNNPSAASLST
jgi:hypothetical protein